MAKMAIYFIGQAEFPSRPPSQTLLLPETDQQMLQDLMSEAMEETDGQPAQGLQQNGEVAVIHCGSTTNLWFAKALFRVQGNLCFVLLIQDWLSTLLFWSDRIYVLRHGRTNYNGYRGNNVRRCQLIYRLFSSRNTEATILVTAVTAGISPRVGKTAIVSRLGHLFRNLIWFQTTS